MEKESGIESEIFLKTHGVTRIVAIQAMSKNTGENSSEISKEKAFSKVVQPAHRLLQTVAGSSLRFAGAA